MPCEADCPGDLECEANVCVKPGQENACECVPCDTSCPGDMVCQANVCVQPGHANACGVEKDGPVSTTSDTGGSPGQTSSGTGAGGTSNCDPPPSVCVPQNTNVPPLAPVCGNRPFSIQLEAQCACDPPSQEREMTWSDNQLPAGLSLSKTGRLSGTLAPGTYTFITPAHLAGNIDNIGQLEQTLEVTDRCLVTFLSEDESPGVPRVAAVRTDTFALDGWMPSEEAVAVERYDISSDGRYLAAVVDGGEALELFALGRAGVPGLDFEHEGSYLAHAFSADAQWLAVVTTDPDSDNQLLQLVKLEGESWQLVDVADNVSFIADLAWFGSDRVLYWGTSAANPGELVPTWRIATSEGVSAASEVFDARVNQGDSFYGFLTNGAGFVSTSAVIPGHVDLASHFNQFFYPFQAVSPGLSYRAKIESNVLTVDPVTWSDAGSAYASAEGCELLRAWSQDERTLLCSSADGYSVFALHDQGDLRGTEIDVDARPAGGATRAALSASGDWLAFLPNEAGLYVVPKRSYAEPLSEEPLLDTLLGGWDFFFTPNERHVVIQQGARLLVGQLINEAAPVEPEEVEVTMGDTAGCYDLWPASKPATWCGAPQVGGSGELSSDERFLAVRDANRDVRLIPLDTLKQQRLGALSDSCLEGCIRFQ